MGKITDLILIGVLCQTCGCFIDEHPVGHPRTCGDCEEDMGNKRTLNEENERGSR